MPVEGRLWRGRRCFLGAVRPYRPVGAREVGEGRRLRIARSIRHLLDLADEAEAALVEGADEDLIVAAVADRLAGCVDAARQRRLGHDAAVPDLVKDLVLRDDAVVVPDQEGQKVEDLRLDMHGLAAAAQLLPAKIKLVVRKDEGHASRGAGSGSPAYLIEPSIAASGAPPPPPARHGPAGPAGYSGTNHSVIW